MGLVAGIQAPPGKIMGHAGALVGPGERSARAKVKALEDAGVTIVNHPSKFGTGMKELLGSQVSICSFFNRAPGFTDPNPQARAIGGQPQKRNIHTLRKQTLRRGSATSQIRNFHILETHSNQMLQNRRVPISEDDHPQSKEYFLQITIDRATRSPCMITSYSIGGESPSIHATSYPLGVDMRVNGATYSSIAKELNCSRDSYESLTKVLTALIDIFFRKEASSLTVRLSRNANGKIAVARSEFEFDAAAFNSSKRQEEIQGMRDSEGEDPDEVEAMKHGIVYIK